MLQLVINSTLSLFFLFPGFVATLYDHDDGKLLKLSRPHSHSNEEILLPLKMYTVTPETYVFFLLNLALENAFELSRLYSNSVQIF